jgi:predicted DNA-binding protein (UPF0251 family)
MSNASLNKLTSACASIVTDAAEAMSRKVVNRPEMSRNVAVEPQLCKTNPRPAPASSPQQRRLSPRQLMAIGLLLAGSSVADAARRLRINPRTIFRWKADPRFVAEIERRAEAVMPRVGGRAGSAGSGMASAPIRKISPMPIPITASRDSASRAEEVRQMREEIQRLNQIAAQKVWQRFATSQGAKSPSENVR